MPMPPENPSFICGPGCAVVDPVKIGIAGAAPIPPPTPAVPLSTVAQQHVIVSVGGGELLTITPSHRIT